MIENLSGIHETVNYRQNTQLRLHYNTEPENFPPHWHTPFEVIMPTRNGYQVKCGDQIYVLKERDIIIICPGAIHELLAPEDGERIIFQPLLSQAGIQELQLLIPMLTPAAVVTPETSPEIHARIHALMLEIKREYLDNPPYAELSIYSHFLEILVLVGRNCAHSRQEQFGARDAKQKEYMEKFLFITNYIGEHFTENLTLEQVASLAGFSKYHFTRLFKQYADTSFYKYLNQKRIEHAKTLLLDPNLSVIEVALASGFSSLSAFLRMFKQLNHCTPTEFRVLYQVTGG